MLYFCFGFMRCRLIVFLLELLLALSYRILFIKWLRGLPRGDVRCIDGVERLRVLRSRDIQHCNRSNSCRDL